jgi:general stress protein 26
MVRVIDAEPGVSSPMTEEEAKNFMANNNNGNSRLLVHLGMVDGKGEQNVIPTGYYFDKNSNKIYITTEKSSKKVHDLRTTMNIFSYCIDNPNPPYKGVRGKGKVKIHEDINHNIPITEKIMTRYMESLENPMAKWVLDETKKGNMIILEITPSYYSTWDYGKSQQ